MIALYLKRDPLCTEQGATPVTTPHQMKQRPAKEHHPAGHTPLVCWETPGKISCRDLQARKHRTPYKKCPLMLAAAPASRTSHRRCCRCCPAAASHAPASAAAAAAASRYTCCSYGAPQPLLLASASLHSWPHQPLLLLSRHMCSSAQSPQPLLLASASLHSLAA